VGDLRLRNEGSAPHSGSSSTDSRPNIFGLRYLEEEAAEIHDVIGCLRSLGTTTGCDDEDQLA
jgi:hypothetical protein